MRTDSNDPETTWTGTAITTVLLGALLTIWSGLGMIYLANNRPDHNIWFWLDLGFLLTGLAFLAIGLGLGLIRRKSEEEAERAETA